MKLLTVISSGYKKKPGSGKPEITLTTSTDATMTLKEWSVETGIPYSVIYQRFTYNDLPSDKILKPLLKVYKRDFNVWEIGQKVESHPSFLIKTFKVLRDDGLTEILYEDDNNNLYETRGLAHLANLSLPGLRSRISKLGYDHKKLFASRKSGYSVDGKKITGQGRKTNYESGNQAWRDLAGK